MKKYLVVLHGARINSGDFLIRDRGVALLKENLPDYEIVLRPSWESLQSDLQLINESQGLIILGGPAISHSVYPLGIPLVENLDDIKVPMYMLGVGSYIYPHYRITNYTFSEKTMQMFKKCRAIGTRDLVTKTILEKNGLTHVSVTGCPALYEQESRSVPFTAPKNVKKILFSTPQRENFQDQSIELAVALREAYPSAEIDVAFNRGYKATKETSSKVAGYLGSANEKFQSLGFKTYDLSGGLDKMTDVGEYDVHIGYRLHSHILFLSKRKVSYLIAEDSRSLGNYKYLSIPGFDGLKSGMFAKIFMGLPEGLLKKILYNLPFTNKLNNNLNEQLLERLKLDQKNDFFSFAGIDRKLLSTYNSMCSFINSIGEAK